MKKERENNMKKIIYIALTVSVCFACSKEKNYLRDGNSEFRDKQYSEAETQYRKSLLVDSTYQKAQYNLANTLYRKGGEDKFKNALMYYGKVLAQDSTKNSSLIAQATFNGGNANFSLAMTDSASKGENYNTGLTKSIQAYERALTLNPSDSGAKYNLALARTLLNKNKHNNQNKDKNKQNQDNKQQNQNPKPQNQNKNNQDKQQSQQAQMLQKQKKQDNQRMLEALQNNEKRTLERLKKDNKNAKQTVKDKDW